MSRRGAVTAPMRMTHDRDPDDPVSEHFERRLSEECGALRFEMADGFGKLRVAMAEMRGELQADIAQSRGELKADIAQLRGEHKTDIAELRGEMRANTGELRAEMVRGNTALLKWLLAFFVSQTVALAAIIRLFLN